MDLLSILTSLAVLLLIGILCSIISERIRIPNVLLLLITGIIIGHITYYGKSIIEFPILFLTGIATFSLVMIIFDSSAKFRIRELDKLSPKALKLTIVFLISNMILMSILTKYIGGISSILLSLVFATLISGTDTSVTLSMLKDVKHEVVDLIKLESILNTPLTVLLPFIIVDISQQFRASILSQSIQQALPVLQQFITGIGSGAVVGIVAFKIMRRAYNKDLSPIAIIATALLAYVLAENLGGNGVLSVTTLGVFFGNLKVKQKIELVAFESLFSNALKILVFILVGLIIKIPFSISFFIKSFLLFLLYMLLRYYVVEFSFKDEYTKNEKRFIALNNSKGIALAVVVLTLSGFNIPGMNEVLNLALAFILYSVIFTTYATISCEKLLKVKLKI